MTCLETKKFSCSLRTLLVPSLPFCRNPFVEHLMTVSDYDESYVGWEFKVPTWKGGPHKNISPLLMTENLPKAKLKHLKEKSYFWNYTFLYKRRRNVHKNILGDLGSTIRKRFLVILTNISMSLHYQFSIFLTS